jgi:hypothetical protein
MQLRRRDDPDVPRAPLLVLLPRQRFFQDRSAQSGPADSQILNCGGCWQRPDNGDITQLTFAGLHSRPRKMGAPRLNRIGSGWYWRPPIAITPHPSPVDIPADIPRRQRFLPFVSRPSSLKAGVAASMWVAPRARRSRLQTKCRITVIILRRRLLESFPIVTFSNPMARLSLHNGASRWQV